MIRRILSTAILALGVFASFTAAQTYTLTTTAPDGVITLAPPGGSYATGTTVIVTVAANPGKVFTGWTGATTSTENTVAVVMEADKSLTASFVTAATGYCTAAGSVGTGADFMNMVSFGNLNNQSAPHPFQTQENYNDYTSMAAFVSTGQTYGLQVTLGTTFPPDQIFVWIDFNQDGTFDTSEVVLHSDYAAIQQANITTVFIPQSTVAGPTRMRVRVQYGEGAPGAPCGTGFAGDVEDYSVIVTKGPAVPVYTLATNVTNGTLVYSPIRAVYDSGETIHMEATPGLGYKFSAWSGDNTTDANPLDLVISKNSTITPVFVTTPICTVTVPVDVTKGSVSISPAGGAYNQGTVIKATVVPAYGFLFSGWGAASTLKDRTIPITLDKSIALAPTFIEGPTCYGDAAGFAGTGADYISYVSFGDIGQSTSRVPKAGEFYSDYTANLTKVGLGQTLPLAVTLNAVFPPDRAYAWIDWNSDCSFDSTEKVLSTQGGLASGDVTEQVVVPTTAKLGLTRMRVRVQYDSLGSAADPLGKLFAGDVQDFSIEVTNAAGIRQGVIANRNSNQLGLLESGKNGFVILGQAGANYSVFDLFGKEMVSGATSATNEHVDLNAIKRGLYFVKLNAGSQNLVQKFLIK